MLINNLPGSAVKRTPTVLKTYSKKTPLLSPPLPNFLSHNYVQKDIDNGASFVKLLAIEDDVISKGLHDGYGNSQDGIRRKEILNSKANAVFGSKSIRACNLAVPFKPRLTNR